MRNHRILTIAVRIIFSVIFLGSTLAYADDNDAPLLTFNGETSSRSVVYDDQTDTIVIQGRDEAETNLIKVYKIGQQFGIGETLQAIMLQESSGISGQVGNARSKQSNRSYGLMQLQLCVIRDILSRYSELVERFFPNRLYSSLKNKELIRLVMNNAEANMTIAAYHFNLYLQMVDNDWDHAVAAYNVGIGGVTHLRHIHNFKYVVGVRNKLNNVVKPFNQLHLLTQET